LTARNSGTDLANSMKFYSVQSYWLIENKDSIGFSTGICNVGMLEFHVKASPLIDAIQMFAKCSQVILVLE